jgi:siroheme synthase
MALEERSRIASFARTLGWPNQLPAAIVVGAGTPGFWSWTGTLDTLDRVSIPAQKRDLPGLIVLGRVVSLAESMMQALAPAMTSRATTPEEGTRWLPTETGERAR